MRTTFAAAAILLLVTVTSCAEGESVRGGAGSASPRAIDGLSVEIDVTEFGFVPAEVRVVSDASVRFVVSNVGLLSHDVALDRGPAGDEPARPTLGSIALAPRGTAALEVVFDEPGEYVLGCSEPGHWASGMRARVIVT